MKTLGLFLAVLVAVCVTDVDGACWKKTPQFYSRVKQGLAKMIEKFGSSGANRPRLRQWWKTRVENGNVDGVPENADDEAYLGALKCRIWLSVCSLDTDPDNENQWLPIKRQLRLLRRMIWNSDHASIGVARRSWNRWWRATFLETRIAAQTDLDGICADWKEKCNVDDGDPTDTGPEGRNLDEESEEEQEETTTETPVFVTA